MNSLWIPGLTLLAGLVSAAFGELASQEIRARLDRIPQALVHLAALRLSAALRPELTDEWLAELHEILRGKDALPITRIAIGTRYALGLLRTSRTISNELDTRHAAPTNASPEGPFAQVARLITPPSRARILPAGTRAFTGRASEMAGLLDLVRDAQRSPGNQPTVVAVSGMPGVGKTAFALHAAHELVTRFPDGHLFANLSAHAPRHPPHAPGEVLHEFLTALDVPSELIPPGLEERAALYRSCLVGTRTLIVLDDAAESAQVRPLLPGTTSCLVMITSRRRMTALDEAFHVGLDGLCEADARALLPAVVGHDRVPADDPAAAELVALCGYLPLAIHVAAGRLRNRPDWTLAELVRELRESHQRLDALNDNARSVVAAFELTYRRLTGPQREILHRLSRFPVSEFDTQTAVAITHTDLPTVYKLLDTLVDQHLLQEPTRHHYKLHDMIRALFNAIEDPSTGPDQARQ